MLACKSHICESFQLSLPSLTRFHVTVGVSQELQFDEGEIQRLEEVRDREAAEMRRCRDEVDRLSHEVAGEGAWGVTVGQRPSSVYSRRAACQLTLPVCRASHVCHLSTYGPTRRLRLPLS